MIEFVRALAQAPASQPTSQRGHSEASGGEVPSKGTTYQARTERKVEVAIRHMPTRGRGWDAAMPITLQRTQLWAVPTRLGSPACSALLNEWGPGVPTRGTRVQRIILSGIHKGL